MFKKYFGLNLIIFVLFIVDRVVKFWFLKNPDFGWDFIIGLLGFRLETNKGIAFGVTINQVLLLILVVIIILVLLNTLIKAYRRKDLLIILSITLIIVGAISNLIDRLRYGFVIDYIDVPFFTVFNLADTMITVGVILLTVKILFKKDTGQENNNKIE